jgi:hypothetical protein
MSDPDQLRAEIAQTRNDLADTVDALSHKANPREQLRSAAQSGGEAIRGHKTQVSIAAGALTVLLVLRLVFRRRRSS